MKKVDIFKIVAVVLAVLGLIFILIGFGKKNHYKNGEYAFDSVNAYVGGDAYNYVINGTYFTGYMVFGGTLLILAGMSYVGGSILNQLERINEKSPDGVAGGNDKLTLVASDMKNAREQNKRAYEIEQADKAYKAQGEWTCSACGKKNSNLAMYCYCGKSRLQ